MYRYIVLAITICCLAGFCGGVGFAADKTDKSDKASSDKAATLTAEQELAQAQIVELIANDRVAYLQGLLNQAQEVAIRAKMQREEIQKKMTPPKTSVPTPKQHTP